MSDTSIDKDLILSVSFEKAGDGSVVSDACMQEIVERLRVQFKNPISSEVVIAGDSDNILTKNSEGELRVQKDTYYSETQDVPVPPSVNSGGTSYLVPATRRRIRSVIMENGDIIDIPNDGQTGDGGDPEEFTYPATLQELADNLNAEDAPFTWAVVGGELTVTSTLGAEISAVTEGGELETDFQKFITVTLIAGSEAGDVTLTFEEANAVANIDYASQFMRSLDVSPGDGFERAYITSVASNRIRVKIEKVSKALQATLNVFTPAQKEGSSEF
jgi:hypothetical protein